MTRAAIAVIDRQLDLVLGLSAITAGFLWLWVVMLAQTGPALCSEAAAGGVHCPLCYPAAIASLVAVLAAGRRLVRREA